MDCAAGRRNGPHGNSTPARNRGFPTGPGRDRLRRSDRPPRPAREGNGMEFNGKVALITGGGNGIGRAVCLGFATRGAKVVVVDRDQAAGEATAGIVKQQGGDAIFVSADVTKSADVQNYVRLALDKYGAIDCFHNNAGIEGSVASTMDYDEEMFDRVMAVNVRGVFLGMRYILPVMVRQGRGSIVNT